jgi:hypothetical protein
VAEALLLVAMIAVPVALGAAATYLRRPWWLAALVAIAVFVVAALAPAPEEGESRVAVGDLGFILVVALIVAGLTWLGAWSARRLRRSA